MSGGTDAERAALQLTGITKRFGDIVALDRVDLAVAPGTVHALLGENGAGKSTLMRVAFGLVRPDSGAVTLRGQLMTRHSPRAATAAGVGMVHQHLSLVPNLSVLENVALGGRGIIRPAHTRRSVEELMSSVGLRVPVDAIVADLSIVEQQRLEILKALSRGARVLVLDEPTAVLAPAEAQDLLRWVRRFVEGGGSVVLVTHKLRDALSVADEVTVLRSGRVMLCQPAAGSTEADLARAMFPEATSVAPTNPAIPGAVVVTATGVHVDGARSLRLVRDASLELSRGEIVGVAAVEGSGHRELLSALAGRAQIAGGALRLPSRIGYIPADRLRDAIVGEFTLTENVALRGAGSRRGRMPWRTLGERTVALLARFAVVAASEHVRARTLSGGNQQRLVVARELEEDLDLLVADNPTRGLDMRATEFVHEQLRAAAQRGAAVVFHSGDLDEILRLATRVLVVFHGQVRAVPLDRDVIGRAMLGADAA